MKIFLDECVDWRLARDIIGHDVKTARQIGWTAIKNGELLALASKHFDVFVTTDRNPSFQQNLASFSIAVIVLKTRTNRLADLRSLVPSLLATVEFARRSTAGFIVPPNDFDSNIIPQNPSTSVPGVSTAGAYDNLGPNA